MDPSSAPVFLFASPEFSPLVGRKLVEDITVPIVSTILLTFLSLHVLLQNILDQVSGWKGRVAQGDSEALAAGVRAVYELRSC